jgi:hypothetical protein
MRLAAVLRARELRAAGQPLPKIASALGIPTSTLHRWLQRADQAEHLDAQALADRTWANGSRARLPRLDAAELDALRAIYLATNRTRADGSIIEACLQAIEQGLIRPDIADLIRARLAAGRPPLSQRQLAEIRLPAPVHQAARAPRRAWLENVSAPGALQLETDPDTGEESHIPPGARWTIDDGSINMLVVVPGLEIPGDQCWEKWGVVVGRFQLLLTVDHRTRCIIGRSYTARPRDSYRAEDITSALHACIAAHGAPREIVLERGISAARQISDTLAALGVQIIRASSPHQKIVESVFNSLWTALSTLPGQVGRFRGEDEAGNRLWTAYREGRRDPRGELMALPDFLRALDAAIERVNQRWVDGRQGRWQPAAWWARQSATRRIPAHDLWMFAPRITAPVTVEWTQVRTSLTLIPGRSEQFTFSAPWLGDWHGAKVKLFFDPLAPECSATAVLAQDFQGHRAGTVLGTLEQIDRLTRYTRRALGYGLDPDIGRDAASLSARQLVADVRAVRAAAPLSPTNGVTTGTAPDRGRAAAPAALDRTPAGDPAPCSRLEPGPEAGALMPTRRDTAPRYTDPRLAEALAELE